MKMKDLKNVELGERGKRQVMYLSLLLAAAFLAFIRQVGWWLAIAIAVGVGIDEVLYLVARRKAARRGDGPDAGGETAEKPDELSAAAPEEPEGADGSGEDSGENR